MATIKPLYIDPTHLIPRESTTGDVIEGSYGDLVKEPSGFPNRTDSTISFDDASRTFSIAPTGTSFVVYVAGIGLTFNSTQSIQIPTSTGLYWVYFSRDTNSIQYVLNGSTTPSIILYHTPIAIIYWNQVQGKGIYLGDERHGIVMDSATHAHLHQTLGAVYRSGLSLAGMIVDGNGSIDSHAAFDCDSGRIADEDIEHIIPAAAILPTFYRLNGGEWYATTPSNIPLIIQSGDTLPSFNRFNTQYELVECTNNEYVLMHVIATNCKLNPTICILGNSYQNKTEAKSGAQSEFLSLMGLPFAEFVPVATVIYQCVSSYTNSVNSRIVSVAGGGDYVDWRTLNSFTATNALSIDSVPDTNPTFTYVGDLVSRIDYSSGNYKVLNYIGDEVSFIDFHKNGTVYRKTFVYDLSGRVTSITETIL